MRSRRATESFTFLPSGDNGETEFSTEFIQGPFNDTMSDEEAHRLLSSGRTRSLPSIQRVIDRKEKQIAKKKQTGKSKFLVKKCPVEVKVDGFRWNWTVRRGKVDGPRSKSRQPNKTKSQSKRNTSGVVHFPLFGPSTFVSILGILGIARIRES